MSESDNNPKKEESNKDKPAGEPWYKVLNSLATSASLIAVPIIIAILGHQHTKSQNQIKQRAEYIKMGLTILQAAPSDENKSLRKWAVDIVNHYSDVKMQPEVETELIEKITLPMFSNVYSSFDGRSVTEHYFSWVGDTEASYYLEIQEEILGKWDTSSWGVSLKGTSTSMEVPINKKLRWRASKYSSNGSIEYANWAQLYIEKSL